MRIALIGAPKSGKSALAAQIRDHCQSEGRSVAIIDNYVPAIEERAKIALGHFGSHLGNLYVALERWGLERAAQEHEHDVVISCGTIIETAVYTAMHFVALVTTLDEAGKIESGPRIDATLRMLAVLYNEVCEYDLAFYLPPKEVTPDIEFMDRQLQAGLEGFKLMPVTVLGDPSIQLADVLKAMSEVRA